MEDKKKRTSYTQKLVFTMNRKKQTCKIKYSPTVDISNAEEYQTYLRGIFVGFEQALLELFESVPVMRPATQVEQENDVYIFLDEERDNQLYKVRKELYQITSDLFNRVIDNVFPDIGYIQGATKEQQEIAFEHTSEEHEEHKAKIAEIAAQVRAEYEEAKGDVTDVSSEEVVEEAQRQEGKEGEA